MDVIPVVTEDGYILTMHRIPPPEPTDNIVFLMHGLASSAADFIVLGPGKALGIIQSTILIYI